MPRTNAMVTMGAAKSFYCAYSKDMDLAVKLEGGGSVLTHNFNMLLAMALDMRDRGEATHFSMIHADIEAKPLDWPDILYREMIAHGGHFISANVPIKDNWSQDKIRTSTAIRGLASEDELWSPRRYILVQDRPTAVPDGFTLAVHRHRKQLPKVGKELIAIAGDKGKFEDLHIRVFDASGCINEEASFKVDDVTADPLRSHLRPLPEPITFGADARRAIVQAAVDLVGYCPAWTFGPDAVCGSDEVLLLNSGLTMLDLNAPGLDGYAYSWLNRIVRDPQTGQHASHFRSEDWEFSHHIQDAGAQVLATWKVPVLHYGDRVWPNFA